MAIQWGNNLQPRKVYHGSNEEFEQYDPSKSKRNIIGQGAYTTTSKPLAASYGKNIHEFELENGDIVDFWNDQADIDKLLDIAYDKEYGLPKEKQYSVNKEYYESKNPNLLVSLAAGAKQKGMTMQQAIDSIFGKQGSLGVKYPDQSWTAKGDTVLVFDPQKMKFVRREKV